MIHGLRITKNSHDYDTCCAIDFQRRPEKYLENPDYLLRVMRSNKCSAKFGGLDFMCFAMLNPKTKFCLHSNEIAIIAADQKLPACTSNDCRHSTRPRTKKFNIAVEALKYIIWRSSHLGSDKWAYIYFSRAIQFFDLQRWVSRRHREQHCWESLWVQGTRRQTQNSFPFKSFKAIKFNYKHGWPVTRGDNS